MKYLVFLFQVIFILGYQCIIAKDQFKIGGLISELADLYQSKSLVAHSNPIDVFKAKTIQR